MKLVKGENLTPAQWDEVLRRFIYRRENPSITLTRLSGSTNIRFV